MFFEKSQTMGSKGRCIDESCPIIFVKCLGVTEMCFKSFSILNSSLTIFSCGIVKVKLFVSIIEPSYFPLVSGIKFLLSSFIVNPAEMILHFTKWVADLASSKVLKAPIPS